MADEKLLQIIRQGVDAWNEWREENAELIPRADLSDADLSDWYLHRADLSEANLHRADLSGANLSGADLSGANLSVARLSGANLSGAKLGGADLSVADLTGANLSEADLIASHLSEANLHKADLARAKLTGADLTEANLRGANLVKANLTGANLGGADLHGAILVGANLTGANLTGADLGKAKLSGAILIETDLSNAILTESRVYGASVWNIKVDENTEQRNLIITDYDTPVITVDNIKVAQFIYLLLTNKEIRDVIDTIGRKGVLLLGRFTEGRIAVLERLQEELRKRGFVPMVFNFDKPEVKDFTETVRILAGLSHFVIADITSPRSAPLELQATVPECMIPFVPILEKGEEPFAMFSNLWIKHREWVLDPIRYPSVDRLIEVLDTEIVRPAQARFADLLARKAEKLRVKDI
jgi:uncharacterized protein YjbI with pentapeptide repeats